MSLNAEAAQQLHQTASTITRGFISATKSDGRATRRDRGGTCGCDNGIAVAFMINFSAPKICFCEVDDFVSSAVHHGLQHVEREALCHLGGD